METARLDVRALATLRALLDAAWLAKGGEFGDHDFEHALGGRQVLATVGGRLVGHTAVVERMLEVDGRPLATGYVEAVATLPEVQRRGYGTAVMGRVNDIVRDGYALGTLSTGSPGFYERLGWECWRGPTFVRTSAGLERTADDDGGILILRTPRSPDIDVRAPIVCQWRPGDVW